MITVNITVRYPNGEKDVFENAQICTFRLENLGYFKFKDSNSKVHVIFGEATISIEAVEPNIT